MHKAHALAANAVAARDMHAAAAAAAAAAAEDVYAGCC